MQHLGSNVHFCFLTLPVKEARVQFCKSAQEIKALACYNGCRPPANLFSWKGTISTARFGRTPRRPRLIFRQFRGEAKTEAPANAVTPLVPAEESKKGDEATEAEGRTLLSKKRQGSVFSCGSRTLRAFESDDYLH